MNPSGIRIPENLKQLNTEQLEALCAGLREQIIATVAENGGHLASNLGAVELTVALLRAFDIPQDQILFDVGHQCYSWKLLTGRDADFRSLRQYGGISGFPNRTESEADLFTTGHASNAISLATGLIRARQLNGQPGHTVAVLGDGALTGGMSYEGLNDAGNSKLPLIVILNDNGMSISSNVGAMSKYLTNLRLSKGWLGTKKAVSGGLKRIPVIGKALFTFFEGFKDHIRNIFVHDKFFSSLGFRYLGPIDGHSVTDMEKIFRRATALNEPVLIHVVTQKGQGYAPAEDSPDVFHGIPPFYVDSGATKEAEVPEFGKTAAQHLIGLQQARGDICAVTAAMKDGTGFSVFEEAFPDRLFDVGIAEEHAVSMAAGLARGGQRPVCAIYNTFLQRGYDQMLMDVCLQKLPVLFLLDRTGLSGPDGASHHGIFGLSYLMTMPGMTLYCPLNAHQLTAALDDALSSENPTAVCYPRKIPQKPVLLDADTQPCVQLREGIDAVLLCAGVIAEEGLKAAELLAQEGISLAVTAVIRLKPLDSGVWHAIGTQPWFTLEENVRSGGFGEMLSAEAARAGITPPNVCFALSDTFPAHGDRKNLLKDAGLDAASLASAIKRSIGGRS